MMFLIMYLVLKENIFISTQELEIELEQLKLLLKMQLDLQVGVYMKMVPVITVNKKLPRN